MAGRKEFEELDRAVEEARLHVPIDSVYPLDQAAQAHARVEQGRVIGRVVIRTRDEELQPRGLDAPPDNSR